MAILDPLVIDAAVKVFARSVARKCCYRQVSLAKKPEFSTTFLSANPRWVMLVSRKVLRANVVKCHYHFGFPSLFRFRRCAGLQTAMRHVEDLANFPDIILDPAKDGIYISVDRSHT